MNAENLPAVIVSDLKAAHDRQHTDAILKSAFAAGWTLRALGAEVGVTREMIRQRLKRQVDASLLRAYPGPTPSRAKMAAAATAIRNNRVNGLRRDSPVLRIPVRQLNKLAEMHALATTVRGWTPLDSPERSAVPLFGALLEQIITTYSIHQGQLEPAMGMGRVSLTAWRRNHGYLPQMPSQKSYRGVLAKHGGALGGPGRKEFQIGDSCRNGHAIGPESLAIGDRPGRCRQCARDRSRASYLKLKALTAN